MKESEIKLWDEVDEFLERHAEQYKMSFALEYSSVIDWVADFTPRRGHPKARQYGEVIRCSGMTREDAMRKALAEGREMFG